jgi:hypothetical protein
MVVKKRFCTAPSWARLLLTVESAASIVSNASVAPADVLISTLATAEVSYPKMLRL